MIAKGDKKVTLYHGDSHPAELYIGTNKVAGYTTTVLSGKGMVEIGEEPYKAAFPSIKVYGEGEQVGIPSPNSPIEPKFLENAKIQSIADGVVKETANLPILRALPNGSAKDEIDVASGTIKRFVHSITVDGNPDEVWHYYNFSGVNGFYMSISSYPRPRRMYDRADISNYLTVSDAGERKNNSFYIGYGGPDLNILWNDVGKDASVFRKKLAEHPITVWYALKDAIIEHYDPTILRQYPVYTQLIQQGGFTSALIECECWKEMSLNGG